MWSRSSTLRYSSEAVSYTHLDVYKRQAGAYTTTLERSTTAVSAAAALQQRAGELRQLVPRFTV